jgi:hypothetical protein
MGRVIRCVAILAIALVGVSAMAQGTGTITAPQGAEFPLANALSAVFTALTNAFKQSYFSPASGLKVVAALAAILVVFSGLKMGFGGEGIGYHDFFADMFKIASVSTVAVCAIQPLSSLAWALGGNLTLGQAIENWFLHLAGADQGTDLITAGLQSWVGVMLTLLRAQIVPDDKNWMWVLEHCIPLLGALIFEVMGVIAIGIAGLITIGNLVAGKLLMDLAISFAPVLVPWILFRPMQFLFDAWLKSIIAGGMLMVVGSFFNAAGMKFAEQMNNLTPMLASSNWEATSIMIAWAGVFFATVAFILIAQKLDGMARSLVSGSGISGFSLQAMRAAMAPSMAAGGAMAGAPGAAASAAHRHSSAQQAVGAANNDYKAATGSDMRFGQRAATYAAASNAYKRSAAAGKGMQNSFVDAMNAGKARGKTYHPPKSADSASSAQAKGGAPSAAPSMASVQARATSQSVPAGPRLPPPTSADVIDI